MPYFVVIRSRERPATIRPDDSFSFDVRALHESFATLAEAEDAARRRAEFEQEYPWTAVYVVEAPHWRRAQHLPDPNASQYNQSHYAIHRAAMADPDGRVPVSDLRLSAFQPPTAPPEAQAPSALPSAAFSDPDVERSLDALIAAGFEAVARDHSAYFVARPQYVPAVAAMERLRKEAMQRGGPPRGISAKQVADLVIRSPADVSGVTQYYQLYEQGGEYDIGKLSVMEFRTGGTIDAAVADLERWRQQIIPPALRRPVPTDDTRKFFRFQTSQLLMLLRLWFPEDGQLAAIVAALEPVLGPATPLDRHPV